MPSAVERREVPIPHSEEWIEIARRCCELECRISVIRSLMNDEFLEKNSDVSLNLIEKYITLATEKEILLINEVKKLIPDDCVSIIQWTYTMLDKIVFFGRFKTADLEESI